MNPALTNLSPSKAARLAGGLYLAVVVLSVFALFSIQGLVASGDPLATARNLSGAAAEFRVAVVANLLATLCYIAVVGLLNELLKPVQPAVSRLAVLFGLGGCIVGAATAALQLAAPASLVGAGAAAMAPSAHTLLLVAGRANSVGLTLFGCYCLLLGWLVLRSGFVPKLLGALLIFSGASWLIGNLALLAEPRLAAFFLPLVGVAALGEILFTLWLVVKGVDVDRWHAVAQARLGAERHGPGQRERSDPKAHSHSMVPGGLDVKS
jgi:hypothetical protein